MSHVGVSRILDGRKSKTHHFITCNSVLFQALPLAKLSQEGRYKVATASVNTKTARNLVFILSKWRRIRTSSFLLL